MVGDRPADDPAGVDVQHRCQVDLALARRVFGDVGEPEPVRRVGDEAAPHEVVVDWRRRTAAAPPPDVDAAQTRRTHQPGHALPAAAHTAAEPQFGVHSRHPVRSARAGVDLTDLRAERLIRHGTERWRTAGPLVVARCRDP